MTEKCYQCGAVVAPCIIHGRPVCISCFEEQIRAEGEKRQILSCHATLV